MVKFATNFCDNYDALTASTKGAAPGTQIMWAATLLTIFESIAAFATPEVPKRFELKHEV